MKDAIEVGIAYYPYKIVNINNKTYYQVKLKVDKYENGRTKYKTISATTKKELIERTKKVLETSITCESEITVKQVALEWLKTKFGYVAPATYDKLESNVNAHIIPEIGDKPISCFNEKFLQNYIDELAMFGNVKDNAKKKGLSYNTLKKIISTLSAISEYAYRKDYIEKNYVKYITIPKSVKKPPEKRILDDNGIIRFMNELNKKNDKGEYIHFYRNAILFMMYTGLRSCEVFALEKDMVDFEKKFIRIERNRVRTKRRSMSGEATGGYVTRVYDDTKNESSRRIVPLIDEAYEILLISCNNSKSKLCFPNRDGRVVKPTTFDQKFYNICKQAEVDITPHALRHTFACNVYYNSKLDIAKLAKLLGHSTPKVTYNTYLHQIEEKEMLIADEIKDLYKDSKEKFSA